VSARRGWALPLVPLYAAALAVKDGLRSAGVLRTRKLTWPVVSVGSLSAGGAGKTPVVIALAKLLAGRGWDVDVLSRGYGRQGVGVERVNGTVSRDATARRFGDEPALIARATRVPVWVGKDRFEAGERAEEFVAREREADPPPAAKDDNKKNEDDSEKDENGDKNDKDDKKRDKAVHLLDDGFQHRQLERTVDVVLITAEDLRDALLPAGNLREPLSALRRADAVIIRQEEWVNVAPRVRELVRAETPMWSVERTLRFPAPLGVFSAGLRPVGFCAIARPEGFSEMLQEAGCGLIEMVVFGDHHSYTMDGIEAILKVAKSLNASGFVTTEKDAVKLTPEMRKRLGMVGPLITIALELEFLNTAEVMSDLEARLT
jgi:tetraacyldisaccharide 4'-kinase